MENFFARLPGSEQQGQEGQTRGQRRHEHRNDTLLRAAHDHFAAEGHPLLAHEVQVVGNHHDPVARGDSGQSDEADHRRDGKHPARKKLHPEDRADKGQRDVQHDLRGKGAALELHVEDKKHGDQTQTAQEKDESRGPGLAFKLSAVSDIISLGQHDPLRHRSLRLPDHRDQIPPGRVGRDVDAPLRILPVDHVRPHGLAHFRDQSEGNQLPGERIHRNGPDRLQVLPRFIGQSQHHVKSPLPLEHLGHGRSLDRQLGVARRLTRTQPVGRAFRAIETDMNLRHQGDPLDLHVGHPRDGNHRVTHLPGQPPQHPEIIAENFDRDLRLHPGEDVVDPVRDRLADTHPDARQRGQPRADVGENFRLGTCGGVQLEFDFRRVDLHDVLVALGPSGPAGDGAGFGHGGEQHLGHAAHPVALFQRGARGRDDKSGDASFVELREKLTPESGQDDQRRGKKGPGREVDAARCGEPEVEQPRFPVLDPPHQPPVPRLLHASHPRQQQGAQGGRHGERNGERCENGHDVGHGQRSEDAPLDALQGEEGEKDEHDQHGGIDNGIADFPRGRDHDIEHRTRVRRLAVLAQAAENIFHIDDGVIDQFADGHGQAAQRHGIDPETGRMKDDEGGE